MDDLLPLKHEEIELLTRYRAADEMHKSMIMTAAKVAHLHSEKMANPQESAEIIQFRKSRAKPQD